MIDRCCPTLGGGVLRQEFLHTAAAFGILTLLGFCGALVFPSLAQETFTRFVSQLEELGLTGDVPQRQLMGTLFFNNVTASLLSMLYGLIPFLPFSALALGTNALLLGVFAAMYQKQGIGLGVYALGVLPHGIFELTALILSCAMGLLLCRTGTDRLCKKDGAVSLFPRILDCLRIFLFAVVPLLLIAAFVETYITPLLLGAVM